MARRRIGLAPGIMRVLLTDLRVGILATLLYNRLNFGGTEIFRYNASFRDKNTQGNQNDTTIGFNFPVTRVRFWGNVWDKALTYKVQGRD